MITEGSGYKKDLGFATTICSCKVGKEKDKDADSIWCLHDMVLWAKMKRENEAYPSRSKFDE